MVKDSVIRCVSHTLRFCLFERGLMEVPAVANKTEVDRSLDLFASPHGHPLALRAIAADLQVDQPGSPECLTRIGRPMHPLILSSIRQASSNVASKRAVKMMFAKSNVSGLDDAPEVASAALHWYDPGCNLPTV